MTIETYFGRPERPIDLGRLRDDILSAEEYLAVASAWFTLTDMVKWIKESVANRKIVILSQSDLNRKGSSDVFKELTQYENELDHAADLRSDAAMRQCTCGAFTSAIDPFSPSFNPLIDPLVCQCGAYDASVKALEESPLCRVVVLGSGDFTEGVMHHKFVIVDRKLVWTGSYNYTFQAKRNYETLIRINDTSIAKDFVREVAALEQEYSLWMGSSQFARANDAFRCQDCMRIRPATMIGIDDGSHICCKACASKI